jgi:hypothetical protein
MRYPLLYILCIVFQESVTVLGKCDFEPHPGKFLVGKFVGFLYKYKSNTFHTCPQQWLFNVNFSSTSEHHTG